MKNLTAKILTLGFLTFVPLTLNAQKYESSRGNKEKSTYSLSRECKDYNRNVYSRNLIGKPVFLSGDARRYSKKVYANRINDEYKGISRQERRYKSHINDKRR